MKHPPKTIVIDWLNTIWETDLPSQSKYLACYLRKFMNSHHDMAYPSYSRIIHETGLSRNTIARYMQKLEEEEWIVRNKGRLGKNTTYTACFPTSVTQGLVSERDGVVSQGHLGSVRETHELNKEVNNKVNNKGKSRNEGKDLPNVEDKNSEEKSKKKESRTNLINQAFDFFWEAWPTKKNKQKALKSFEKVCGSKNDEAVEGLTNTLCADIDKRLQSNDFGFDRMHATTYLNNKRWEDDISAGDYK